MTVYSKFNIVYHLQKWMDSVPGQTFLNYAYSWGASVVILGTLFKLTHLPGANFMLFAGMGTEVFVFFLSAFDRPFDKTQEGKDLPTHIDEEEIDREEVEAEAEYEAGRNASNVHGGVAGGGTIIIGGAAGSGNVAASVGNTVASGVGVAASGASVVTGGGAANVQGAAPDAAAVAGTAAVAAEIAASRDTAAQLVEAQSAYLEQLKNLTETLQKVSEQSVRLTRDSEEMENLNRTLTGICKVYEMQLKGASQQIGTIDQINDQSRHMAQQIEQLNSIYARMIEAMTVNMNLKAKE